MLPLITEEHSTLTYAEVFQDINGWRKQMVQHLKEENPEVNSAILEVANNTELDPKAVALGAFMVYRMLELANEEAWASKGRRLEYFEKQSFEKCSIVDPFNASEQDGVSEQRTK